MLQFVQQYWLFFVFVGVMLVMHRGGHRHGGAGMLGGCGGHGAHRRDGHVERRRDAEPAAPPGHAGTPQDAVGASASATPQDAVGESATPGRTADAAEVGPLTRY